MMLMISPLRIFLIGSNLREDPTRKRTDSPAVANFALQRTIYQFKLERIEIPLSTLSLCL